MMPNEHDYLSKSGRQRAEAPQTLLLRGIQPEQLIALASTLDRLSETDVEDLLASRDSGKVRNL